MKIKSAEFVRSAFDRTQWANDAKPEIAFLGRSNVGKSSLLNSLLGRKGLARTSNTPGRTQSINYFLINDEFYFVDLPGYGYAKVSKAMRQEWGKLARDYLTDRAELALHVQLVDSRHPPSELDMQLHEWLTAFGKHSLIVATKIDKLSKNELFKSLRQLQTEFDERPVFGFSSVSGAGREEIWNQIEAALKKS